jgi:VWFA-related protein
MRIAPVIVTLSLIAPALFAQEQTTSQTEITYQLRADRVAIPVYVVDRDGNPVRGLTVDDFEVREGRKTCRLESVEFIDHAATPAEAYGIVPPEARRHFLLLFDLNFTNPNGFVAARKAALDFLNKHAFESDLIAVITIAGPQGIELLCPFTTDRARIDDALGKLARGKAIAFRDPSGFSFEGLVGQIDPDVAALMRETDRYRYSTNVTKYISVLELLGESLNQLHGRKNIILFSDGFDEETIVGDLHRRDAYDSSVSLYMPTGNELSSVTLKQFEAMLKQFYANDAVFYVIDTNRLAAFAFAQADNMGNAAVNPLPGRTDIKSQTGKGDYALFRFAEDTHGVLYKNLNDLDAVLADISRRTAAGYLLIFEPSRPGNPGEFREITVRAKRRDLRVDHQRGYSFEKLYSNFTPEEKQIQLGEFVSKDILSRRIPFLTDIRFFPGDKNVARLPVLIEIAGEDLARYAGHRHDKAIHLEFYGYLLDAANSPRDFFFATVGFEAPETLERLLREGTKYYGLLLAPPGPWKIRCLVRDSELGLISSDIRTVDVPDFNKGELRLTGPLFVETVNSGVKAFGEARQEPVGRREGMPVEYPYKWRGRDFVPRIEPRISPGSKQIVFVRLYGLGRDTEVSQPRVDLSFAVVDSLENSNLIGAAELVDRLEFEDGSIGILFGFDLTSLGPAPGHYRLRLRITDQVTGAIAAADAPFIIP